MRIVRFIKVDLVEKRKIRRRLKEHFSPSFYLSQLSEVDRVNIVDPLEHFLIYWSKNGKDPNPFFSMNNYLKANPDVAASGQNPLIHFLTNGLREKRPLEPTEQSDQSVTWPESNPQVLVSSCNAIKVENRLLLERYLNEIGISTDFEPNKIDEIFYRAQLADPDIGDCNKHYEEVGWKLGLNPTPWFSTSFYLEIYDDVNQAGINPFTHFINQGFHERRIPNHSNFRSFTSVLRAQSVEAQSRNWHNPEYEFKLLDLKPAIDAINKIKMKDGSLIISIGHSNYLNDVGGIQLYTFAEAKKFIDLGINYLHLSPSRTLPVLADLIQKDLCIRLILNNKEIAGDFLLSDLVELIRGAYPESSPLAVIVNSLFGWHPELLVEAIKGLNAKSHYWVFHDYSAFCINPTLSFENVASCRNPKPSAGICGTCRFGKKRNLHIQRMGKLLNSRDWIYVTPSRSATENVSKYLDIDISHILTIPHGHLSTSRRSRLFESRPRVAFVGHPVMHKGWLNFLQFVNLGLKEFDFYHFGSIPTSEHGIRYFPLRTNYKDLNAARDLLLHHCIDAVFICPNWEETFCFVAFEALAAGCMVICNGESGNVFDAAGERAIIYDPNAPTDAGEIRKLIVEGRELDSHISDFVFSGTVATRFPK